MSFNSFAVLGVVFIFALLSLIILFSQNSVVGLTPFSGGLCSLQDGFEKDFTSKNECIYAANDLCGQNCPSSARNCFFTSKRICQNIGKSDVRVFR